MNIDSLFWWQTN